MKHTRKSTALPAPLNIGDEQKEERNTKGEGSIFQRGDGYWILQLRHEGQTFSTSLGKDESKARKKAVAAKRKLLVKIERGEPIKEGSATVSDICDLYIAYAKKNLKSWVTIEQVLNANIKRSDLCHLRAGKVTTADLEAYRKVREQEGAEIATINNELAYLRAAYYRAKDKRTPPLVNAVPAFPFEDPKNQREGFLDDAGYKLILEQLPPFVKLIFVLAFHLGCRRKEILNLKWKQVFLEAGYIDLQKTKNGKDRIAPIYFDMLPWLTWQLAIRDKYFPKCEFVIFHHKNSRLAKGGDPVFGFYGSWKSAVKRAGYDPGLLLHDMRRTACRNMVQKAKIPRAQAKVISGHITDSTFDRYNIVDPEDAISIGAEIDKWMKTAVGSVKPPSLKD